MKVKWFVVLAVNLFCLAVCFPVDAKIVPFDSKQWTFAAKEYRIENYKGREALRLKGGMVYLKDADFLNGVIEFDIAIPNDFGFMGAVWRLADPENYEEFYIRSSRSGQPDANQYSPVFNGLSAWQLYHGEGFSAPTVYRFDDWMHVKIVVSGKRGAVYLSDMKKPAFIIEEFKRESRPGGIGLKVTDFAPGRFANFQFREEIEPIPPVQTKKPVEKPSPGTLLNYRVSGPFDEKLLQNPADLKDFNFEKMKWTKFETEVSGLANLARIFKIKDGNTVFARVLIEAEKPQIKKIQFGYSDRIIVFLNKLPLYSGNNVWRSRDFRYLGTIGYFDEVYLSLNKGENELLLAVSEDFGGWGLQTRFPNSEGITIK